MEGGAVGHNIEMGLPKAVIKNRNVFSCQFPLYYKSVKEIDDGPRPIISRRSGSFC
jgi:hypothetical protein